MTVTMFVACLRRKYVELILFYIFFMIFIYNDKNNKNIF